VPKGRQLNAQSSHHRDDSRSRGSASPECRELNGDFPRPEGWVLAIPAASLADELVRPAIQRTAYTHTKEWSRRHGSQRGCSHPASHRGSGTSAMNQLDDEEVLAELYRRYRQPLHRFVLGLTAGDQHLADDIVQETMFRAWRNASRLEMDCAVMPWLATVARRLVIDQRRRRSTRPEEVGALIDELPTADESEGILRCIVLAEALQDLTPAHRDALIETFIRNRTVKEAAEILHVPPGTVKSRIYYALRALRLIFEERGIEA
jgi:RNA polymerase sigma factor (sigma-70 family)